MQCFENKVIYFSTAVNYRSKLDTALATANNALATANNALATANNALAAANNALAWFTRLNFLLD